MTNEEMKKALNPMLHSFLCDSAAIAQASLNLLMNRCRELGINDMSACLMLSKFLEFYIADKKEDWLNSNVPGAGNLKMKQEVYEEINTLTTELIEQAIRDYKKVQAENRG